MIASQAADVAQKLNDADQLEKPILDPKAEDFLLEAGWDCVFSWMVNNKERIPEDLFTAIRALNTIEYLTRQSYKAGGIAPDDNQNMPAVVLALINSLARLGRL